MNEIIFEKLNDCEPICVPLGYQSLSRMCLIVSKNLYAEQAKSLSRHKMQPFKCLTSDEFDNFPYGLYMTLLTLYIIGSEIMVTIIFWNKLAQYYFMVVIFKIYSQIRAYLFKINQNHRLEWHRDWLKQPYLVEVPNIEVMKFIKCHIFYLDLLVFWASF